MKLDLLFEIDHDPDLQLVVISIGPMNPMHYRLYRRRLAGSKLPPRSPDSSSRSDMTHKPCAEQGSLHL